VAAPPLDLLCDRPVTYPGDNKILEKSSKETPLIRNNWNGEPSGHAENQDNWIFFLK
jgi:hypothetical protein